MTIGLVPGGKMAGDPLPARLGYRLVPDAMPLVERRWLAWPHGGEHAARDAVLALAEFLSNFAAVTILANPSEVAEVSLRCPRGVTAMAAPHDGCRLKAQAPLFLRRPDDGAIAALAPASPAAVALLRHLGCPFFPLPAWLRPDYIDADGSGVLLASRSLLDGRSAGEAGRLLRDLTGSEQVVWLDSGLAGFEGPVAGVARCLGPGLAMATVEEDRSDENYRMLRANLARLGDAGLTVVGVRQPLRRPAPDGGRLPAAYTACVISGAAVVLPAFEEGRDDVTLAAIGDLLPDRRIVLQPARDLVAEGYEFSDLVLSQPPMGRAEKP